jgi:hypothetical protein
MDIEFLPETPPEVRAAIKNIVGSWRIEGLEIRKEAIRDMELCSLGKITSDGAVRRVIERAIDNE